ncbi:testis-specific Y-encoded-like protein 2 isoform X2 [Tenrec ecaudatus]|uniref:testis-specific Y-encoded-like protein 2 isoform X2 n=1 Tax=Tenrec ecaudatus TaxID=94439 RepID=UPI003F5A4095
MTDRPDEEPPVKTRRRSSPDLPQCDLPPPPPLLQMPPLPPLQRPRLREETEAAQVLADMRGGRLGPTLPPPPPYVILEEGGIRAYFTLGAGSPGWEPAIDSGYGGATPPPTESLGALSTSEASGENLEIGFQVTGPSSFAEEKALETCSVWGWRPQRLASPKWKEEAVIIVEEYEEEMHGEKRRKRRKRRKMKKESNERNAQRMEYILEALEDIQLDLEAVNMKAGKAFLRLKRKFIQIRRPFLEHRNLIIQRIPGFWIKAFLNHPKISILINQRDEDIFCYLTNLQVQDLRHVSMGYRMKLYFQTNPYFTNMVIVKEFQHNHSGRLVSHSTPIRWHRGQEPQVQNNRNQTNSFFNWFANHSLPDADRIAEIIKNDLWVDPLRYYMLGEERYRSNRRKQDQESNTKDECEVMILEDSDDYQAVRDISETSDSDVTTDNENISDIKISDFMETTDYFDTTDSEISDISESLCYNENPNHNESPDNVTTDDDFETTDDNESANDESPDDNSENPEDNNKNACHNENPQNNYGSSDDEENVDDSNKHPNSNDESPECDSQINSSNQGSCDSDNEGDVEGSDDEDDGNEGDSEGSDDDGNEGDNESSDDDDDEDSEGYEKGLEDPDQDQDHSNNLNEDELEVEDFSEEEEECSEEDEETGCDWAEIGEPGH